MEMGMSHGPMDMSHGDTGTFGGHVIGGTAFMVFGVLCTVRAWVRVARAAAARKPFDMHEPSRPFLRVFGVLIMLATAFGMAISNAKHKTEEMRLVHVVVYFSWFTVGTAGLLESCGMLPTDSVRLAAALAGCLEFIVFCPHVALHHAGTMQAYHMMLLIPMISSFATGLAAYTWPASVVSHLGLTFSVTLQGAWFNTMAWTFYGAPPGAGAWLLFHLTFQQVPALFVLTTVTLFALHLPVWHLVRCCVGSAPGRTYGEASKSDGDVELPLTRDMDSVGARAIPST